MAIISEKSFVNGAEKNQRKKTQRPQTAIVAEADFLSRGGDEMQRRKTAFESYKAARAALQQEQQRRQQEAAARRVGAQADALQKNYYAYRQAGAPQAAQDAAYQNYKRALGQQYELDRANALGQQLDPKQMQHLTAMRYRDPAQAAAQEAAKNTPAAKNRQWSEEREQKRREQLSEQEFNRSGAMQEQYGSYDNYLRGVYAGYDEAAAKREAEQAKTSEDLRAESDALQTRLDALSDQLKTAYQNPSAESYKNLMELQQQWKDVRKQKKEADQRVSEKQRGEKRSAKQAAQKTAQEKYSGWSEERMQGRLDELNRQINLALARSDGMADVSALKTERETLEEEKRRVYPTAWQKAGRFLEDAGTAFYEGGNAQAMSGLEMAHNVAETKVNQGAAWALRDIANSATLHALGGDRYAEKLRSLADRLATEYDYTDAQAWQDEYNRIMNEVSQDHSPVGTWILQQLPSAGAMMGDLMVSTATGGTISPMTAMGIRAGGNAMLDAHNEGATDTQAVLIGLQNAAVEMLSEKLFGGNPVYDEDVGLVNKAVSKLTKSKTVMRVLDSKAFDFASEGLEEVVAELLEPTFQSFVLKGTLKGATNAENIGNAFLGGVFLAALGDLAGLPGGLTQAKQERQTRYYAKILAEQGAQSENAGVREAAAAVQEKLDYGRTPDMEDIGRVLSAMDDAGETQAAQEAAEAAQSSRAYNQYEKAVEDVQQSRAAYEQAQRQQAQQGVDLYDEDGSLLDVGEGWAEIDPEQYAGRQAAQAEAEMNAAAAEADDAYLERQAKKHSYDDLTTSYFANGNTTDLSVEEYAGKFQKVYERGQMGVSKEWALAAATGMNRDVAAAAWEAGRKAAQQSGAAQYSISQNYRQKLRQWNRDGKPQGASFELGTTGATLQGLGAVESDIYMNGDKIKTILKEHPEITMQEIERVPEILEDPVLILKSKAGRGDNSRLVLFGSVKAQNGQPMLAVLDLRATEGGFLLDDMQKVNSAYTKKNPASFIQSSEVLYADEKRTIPLLHRTGLTIASQRLLRNGSMGSISYSRENVNLKGVPFGEVVQAEQKGEHNGSNVSDEGQKRNAGARAGEQARRMEQAAGGRSESARRGRERAAQAKNLSGAWPRVTNAALLGEGGTQNTVAVMPAAEIAKNADAKQAADFFRTANIKRYKLVVGQLEIERDGKTFRADGATLADGTVLVRLDSEEFSAFQLAKHEVYHIVAQRNAELAQRIRKRLVAEGKISRAQIDSYIEAYNAIYGDNTDAYVEEIVADAYAGINRTAYGTNSIRAEVTMEAGQWTKKTGSARAPPESRYSIEKTEDGRKYVLVDQQQGRFIGLSNKEAAKLAKEIIQEEFSGQTLPLGEYSAVTVRRRGGEYGFDGAKKYAYDGSRYGDEAFQAKMRAAANLDEMLEASEYIGHSDDRKNHIFATDGFDYYKTTFVVGGRAFEGVFNIGLSDMGATFYGMTKIEQVTDTDSFVSSRANETRSDNGDLPKSKVARNGENVNGKFSASAEQSDERKNTQAEITAQYRQSVHDILNGTNSTNDALLVGYTPEVYQKLGMPDLPFVVGSGHVYSMAKTADEASAEGKFHKGVNYHGLGENVVADILDFVKDPVMVISAKDVDTNTAPMRSTHSVVALIDVGTGKESMVIPVAITAERTVNGMRMDVNAISSAYEKNTTGLVNEAIAQFNAGENSVFYVKKGAANLLGAGVQFPEQLKAAASSDGIVRKFDSKINMSVQNVTESKQFKNWFGDWQNHPERASKVVNADGTPKVVYHQTENEFTVFDVRRNGAGTSDNETPFGIFLKSNDKDIGLRGKNQMALYANIRNPLPVQNRAELKQKLRALSPEYDAIVREHTALDAEYKQRFEEAKNNFVRFLTDWKAAHPGENSRRLYGTPEFERVFNAEDTIVEEWGEKANELSYRAKEVLTDALRKAGYDGIILANDAGSWGRSTDAYIALDPEQIKSATDNVGTFDRNNPDIRFSASAEQSGETYKGIDLAEDGAAYTYDFLTAQPDMNVTTLPEVDAVRGENNRVDTAKVVQQGMKNARAVGTERDGKVYVQNRYTGRTLRIDANSIRHGLNGDANRLLTNARLGAVIGDVVQNAVPVNALRNKAKGVAGTYAMAAYATDSRGREFAAVVTVEQRSGNVAGVELYDVTHAVSGRQKRSERVGTKPQGVYPSTNASSKITVADFLQIVNGTHQSILSQDVLDHFGETKNPGGYYTGQAKFATAQQRFRDALPERAAEYVARTENALVRRLADNLSVPEAAKRETLRPIADEIIYDVLRGGEIDNAKLNRLFEQAWEAGREADTEYYEQYKDVREKIRTQRVSISLKDRADIADFGLFRRQTMGTLRITSDGLPVDTFYQEMRDMAPELFPASITAPSDQLIRLYEVAQSIRAREKTLEEAFGAQAESFKTWARNDFDESVQRLAEGIRIAQRYQEAQERRKEKLGVPQTAEEAMELAKEVKAEKKKFQKVQSRYLLTDADQKVVNMLLRGDTTPEAVQGRENAEAILKTYEAKADYDLLALRLKAWNNNRKQGMRDQAEDALNAAEAEKWVDKGSGLAYMRETMERNVRDIAKKGKVADEKAEAFNHEYFYPVHKNESDRKNYVVGLQDRIRALDLSRKVENGNLVSESYAVQWLGEAEFNREYLAEHPRVKQRGGFSYAEWNAAIQKFHEENPKLDYAKIENAVRVFRSVYDQLFEDMNRVRMENGYEPVDYMQGYFPHFQENDQDGSLLTRFGRHLGITDEVTPLPATINGLTQTFRPGIRYMANIQQRLGYATAYDALQGFDRYIEVASDVICHTGDIQRLRALATQIRYRASDEGVRKQIDKILQDPTLTPDKANDEVVKLMENARFALSNFVAELDEYTNLLAGKKSRLDRKMEAMCNRKIYNVAKAFESRVGANMVAANIGSALTNFIPITQAWSQVSSVDMLQGMWQTLRNYKTADGLDAASTFINNRSGYGRLAMSTMDKVSKKAGFLMEAVDGFTTGSVVRARYLQNLRLGMSEVNAMQEADQFAAGIMADRSKGSTPTLYSSRDPIIKLFTQFQLEVNNELSWIFKDMIPQERKKGVAQLAKALFKFLIGAWLYNEVYEAIVGRRAALDPLDILNDSVGDFTGYQLPNTVQSALSGRWDFTKEKPGTYQAIKNLGGNLISELPGTQMLTALGLDEKWGLEIDSGRIAVSSAIPNFGNIEKALLASNEDMAPKKKVQTVVNELANPAAYLALPFGGGQIKKMAQGAQAVVQGGSYKADNEGRDILQYPVYNDNPKDLAKNLAQALLFGKSATEEAQGWVESGFRNLSAKETAAYQEMTAAGADQRDSYTFVGAMKKLDGKEAKLTMLFAYDLPEEGKTAYYYNALADDTERGKMDALAEQGVSHSDYVSFRKAYFGAYGTQSVSQERVNAVLDKLDLPKAKKAAIWRSCNKDWKEENNPYK